MFKLKWPKRVTVDQHEYDEMCRQLEIRRLAIIALNTLGCNEGKRIKQLMSENKILKAENESLRARVEGHALH